MPRSARVESSDEGPEEEEQRATFLRDGRESGFTKHLMIRILAGAGNQASAVVALMKAAKKTARSDEAQAAASEVMIGTFDEV